MFALDHTRRRRWLEMRSWSKSVSVDARLEIRARDYGRRKMKQRTLYFISIFMRSRTGASSHNHVFKGVPAVTANIVRTKYIGKVPRRYVENVGFVAEKPYELARGKRRDIPGFD